MSITISTTTTTTRPTDLTDVPAAWTAWRELSESLALSLAIDAASRRIAAAYCR